MSFLKNIPLLRSEVWGRLVLQILNKLFYRLQIVRAGTIPAHGPVLIVCNHVSHLDSLLLFLGVRRKVHFLVWNSYIKTPFFRWMFHTIGALPVSGLQDSITQTSIIEARLALARGEAVCIFSEGAVSRTTSFHPFKSWYDLLLEGLDVPVVPVFLDNLSGGLFIHRKTGYELQWPYHFRCPMTLSFGSPLPPHSSAEEVRLAVMELGTDAWDHHRKNDQTLATQLLSVARRHPFRLCMTDTTGVRLTYASFLTGSFLLARWLQKNRPKETNIGILLPATTAGALVNSATALAGRTAVNINFTLGPEAMKHAIQLAEIRTIFTSRAFLEKTKIPTPPGAVFLEDLSPHFNKPQKLFAFLFSLCLPSRLFLKLTGAYGVNSADPAVIVFSSGSTAIPKGVVITHHNILSNLEAFEQVYWVTKDDAIAGILPFFHSFGYSTTLWFPLLCCFRAAYHSNPLDSKGVGALVRNEKCTFLLATPSFMQTYIKRVDKEDFASLKYPIAGGEKLRKDIFRDYDNKFGQELFEGYGCTEMSPVIAANSPDFNAKLVKHKGHKPGTVGQPLPGVSVKIVDPISRERLSIGQEGLLLVKGPNRMRGYLKNPAETADVFHRGWYVTGDLAMLDADGFLTLTGRLTRFSKIGGEMVPHGKIEHALMDLDLEYTYAVTGVSDYQKGERLIVLHNHPLLNVEDAVRKLRELGFPNLWIPKMDAFYYMEQLPIMASGKLDLRALKRLAEEMHRRSSGTTTPAPISRSKRLL